MGEKDELLASIARTISTYREGEIAAPTPDHVGRWVSGDFQGSCRVSVSRCL